MTVRLVALMTFVLVLCLASFALLLSHHQTKFNAELTRTVSEVSQATVRSLDLTWMTRDDHPPPVPDDDVGDHTGHDVRIIHKQLGPGAPRHAPRTVATEDRVAVASGFVMIQREGEAAQFIPFDDADDDDGAAATLQRRTQRITETVGRGSNGERTVFVRVEEVKAEEAPGKGLLLRIPAVFGGADRSVAALGLGPANAITNHEREIVLPISTTDFQELFASMRRRSLLLFVGVLIVGVGLSTALAHRFTRPVRRLDQAFERLSDGDLDVAVATVGGGEIGRLGVAFNEMAGKLRSNRARERELTRRERLAALGRLAAGVAHDVRNPLHSIGLTLQHIQETCRPAEATSGDELDRSLGIIRGEIRRLDELVQGFMRFAHSDRKEPAPVDVAALLNDVAQLVEKEAERRSVTLVVDAPGPLPELRGDPNALRSAVLNLIMNGFDAIDVEGTLTLSARATASDVRIEVRDDGRGIPTEEQENVFDFAYTTRDGGHGLGLAMVHQVVVEEHGGQVTLTSQPGDGTVVQLTFPLSGQAAT